MNKLLLLISLQVMSAAGALCQIGFGTITPNSSLEVKGAVAGNYRSFTGNTTLGYTDYHIVFTGSAAADASLPDAISCPGRVYWIKNASATMPTPVLTIKTTSLQTIETAATMLLDEPNELVRLVSNGANWEISLQDVPMQKSSTSGGAWNQGGNTIKAFKTIGTITAFDFPFIVNNSEAMRLSVSGFLGLGTSNPEGRLHLVNENDETGNDYIFTDYSNGLNLSQGLLLRKSRGLTSIPENLQNGDIIGQFGFAARYNGSLVRSVGSGLESTYRGTGTENLTDLQFNTSNVEHLLINENGKVAIGSYPVDGVNPEKLLVDGTGNNSFNVISGKGSINNYLQLNIQNKATGAATANMASSDVVATADNGNESVNFIDMGINSQYYNNTTFPLPVLNSVNMPYVYSTGADLVVGNGAAASDMFLFTGGYLPANERIRITAAGNVGIGVSAPTDKLSVAGILTPTLAGTNLYALGDLSYRWTSVWATGGLVTSSDERLKTNILSLDYGLKETLLMKPVSYYWKETPSANHKIGLIAQDLQKIIPEAVTGNEKTGYLGVNYAELAPVLIRAIQQQQERLIKMQAELALLTGTN